MINLLGSTTTPPPKKRELELAERVMLAAHSQTSLTYLWCCLPVEMAKVQEILAAEKSVGEVVFDGWANAYGNEGLFLHSTEAIAVGQCLNHRGRTIRVRVYEVPEGAP